MQGKSIAYNYFETKNTFDKLIFNTGQVFQRGKLNVIVLIQQDFQLQSADPQISLVEFVLIVPTDRSKFPPLLNDRVEETEGKK